MKVQGGGPVLQVFAGDYTIIERMAGMAFKKLAAQRSV
jgi:hypothetical protein